MNVENEMMVLSIETRGEVISSNFPAFADAVRERLAEINQDLSTDEDFDRADADAKLIAGAEADLRRAKEKALSDAVELEELFSKIDGLSSDLSKARLSLTKQIAKRKLERQNELIDDALATFDIDPRDARRQFLAGLQNAIKGKRAITSMEDALRIYSVNAQELIRKCRESMDVFEKKHGKTLIPDRRELELKSPDYVDAELRRRVEAAEAEIERQRLRNEAAEAQSRANKANEELAEVSKPPAVPVYSALTISAPPAVKESTESSATVTRDEEWQEFKAACVEAFKPLKSAREKLTHSGNIATAKVFANSINSAWKGCF